MKNTKAKYLESESVPKVRERMFWRRWAIRNKCENNLKKFKQEYSQDIQECFQSSGVSKSILQGIKNDT